MHYRNQVLQFIKFLKAPAQCFVACIAYGRLASNTSYEADLHKKPDAISFLTVIQAIFYLGKNFKLKPRNCRLGSSKELKDNLLYRLHD